MDEQMNQFDQQRRLWQRYAHQAGAQPSQPDLDSNLLAAYLDGRADPEQIDEVEARLAGDPGLLEQFTELRGLGDIEPEVVSASLLERAKALVPAGAGLKAHLPFRTRIGQSPWWLRLGHVAAAAAILLASLAGYSVGQATFGGQRRA